MVIFISFNLKIRHFLYKEPTMYVNYLNKVIFYT